MTYQIPYTVEVTNRFKGLDVIWLSWAPAAALGILDLHCSVWDPQPWDFLAVSWGSLVAWGIPTRDQIQAPTPTLRVQSPSPWTTREVPAFLKGCKKSK